MVAAALTPVVRATEFGKRYGRTEAVTRVSLEVSRGEVYGLIGPDGAGKSSLMKALAGVLSYESGMLEVFGERLDSESNANRIKARIGFMPQGLGLNLYPELSVEENVDFFGRLRDVSSSDLRARKRRLLGITRLDEFSGRPMKALSGGMKQKLALVCTLVHAPDLLILDEPTTGVDAVSRRDFWAILADLIRDEHTTAVISTAYLDEASRFDRMSLLFDGATLAAGTVESLSARARGVVIVCRVPDGTEIVALGRLREHFPHVEILGSSVRAFIEPAPGATAEQRVRAALGDIDVADIREMTPELEDVFIALIRQRGPLDESPSSGTFPRGNAEALSEPTPHGAGRTLQTAIEATDLTRDFGAFRAVDGVSFRVSRGEIFGLLGANGAGKTTVIKMLTGIIRPTAGSGHIAGVDMRRAQISIKRRIGYMSQAFSLYTDLTVAENISLYAGIHGLSAAEARERAAWVSDMAGLGPYLRMTTARVPMGVRQRLALGCALVHRPEVLFLDEPTSGVDPIGRRRFWDILFRLTRQDGVAILVTTHYMNEAEHCDRVALMFGGRVVADAPPDVLKADARREAGVVLEVGTETPHDALTALRASGYDNAALFGRRVHVVVRDPAVETTRIRRALEGRGVGLQAIHDRPMSLEDVFVLRVTALERASREGRAP